MKPGPVRSQRRGSVDMDIKLSRRADNFTLSDYTPQKLAEQLTLIEQVLHVPYFWFPFFPSN